MLDVRPRIGFSGLRKSLFLERPCTFLIIMIGKLAAVRKMEGCRAWNRKELGRHMKFALPPAKNRNTPQKEFYFWTNWGTSIMTLVSLNSIRNIFVPWEHDQ